MQHTGRVHQVERRAARSAAVDAPVADLAPGVDQREGADRILVPGWSTVCSPTVVPTCSRGKGSEAITWRSAARSCGEVPGPTNAHAS
jgi:hypothetical protein